MLKKTLSTTTLVLATAGLLAACSPKDKADSIDTTPPAATEAPAPATGGGTAAPAPAPATAEDPALPADTQPAPQPEPEASDDTATDLPGNDDADEVSHADLDTDREAEEATVTDRAIEAVKKAEEKVKESADRAEKMLKESLDGDK